MKNLVKPILAILILALINMLKEWYFSYSSLDNRIVHFFFGALLGWVAGECWALIDPEAFYKSKLITRCFGIFAGAMTLGVIWEIFEYFAFSPEFIAYGTGVDIWTDTVYDMIMNAPGGLTAGYIFATIKKGRTYDLC